MMHMSWISLSLMQTLAWTLLHFLWQGLALAGVCAAVMAACRTASVRYVVALSALALMLAAPVITFFALQHSAAAKFADTAALSGNAAPSTSSSLPPGLSPQRTNVPFSPAPLHSDALIWLVEAWFAGVVFFSLRTAGGLIVVGRMRRKETRPVAAALLDKCRALQRRMRIERVIRYCEGFALEAPAVIGWFRPIVLLPVTALSGLSEDQLAAVISHELAHIRRLDSFVNLFQIAAETLLFYHPAVWWLNKRIRNERENCCDDAALAVCGNPLEYARALTLMEEWRQRPALAMAANRSPLVARVARMLGIASPRSGIRTAGVAAGVLCFAGALLAANGLFAAGHASPRIINGSLYPVAQSASSAKGNPARAPRARASASPSPNSSAAVSFESASPGESAQSEPAPQAQASQSSSQSQSYVDQMKAQGYDNLTADELISLKVQGVTPEYIQQIKALGLHPSVGELIALRVQGIDPQYIKDMRATGFNPDINQLISLRVQGVTPEYVRDMRAAGINGDASQFIGMKVQGLTPEYVKEMKATGLNLSANQLVAMKIQGLDPDYIRQMKAAGISANPDQLIGMKIQGLTPQYVSEMKSVGVTADANQLIGMKVQGLTAEYVKEMTDAGVKASVNELIGMKVQGLDPEYVKDMKAVGVTANANQLIGMKVQGLTAEYVKEMTAAGVKASVNQLISMKIQGLTADYIKQMVAVGVNVNTSQLIGMRVQGLTPDYVKEMKALGVNAGGDQWIGMRVEGVTPEYVKSLQSAGLQNLSVDDYIKAREMGITPDFISKVRSHGFKDLTIDKLVELKNAGVF